MPMQDIINRDDDNLTSNITNSGRVAHVFDDQFRDFVRMKAWMIFLIPSLEAYSNNPHKNGTLPKTLYYQFLDAVDKQPDSWRANQLAPVQIEDNSTALQAYRGTMGELLKHQRSHLCTLQLLTNILETQRIAVKGKVPNCKKMITTLTSNITNSGRVAHVFDDQFRDFVRMKAWMIFLIPSLEAYSNNPHKNGTLPKTLYYQFLDAVDKQPDSWRANQLAPVQIEDNSTALQAYRGTMGELLKHQRSHLCTLQLLTNILETQRIAVKGKVPNCKKMITTLTSNITNSGRVAHVFDDQFRDFVRMKAWMIFLIPSLEAYSNNPHKNGTLPKTLYYQFLDAVDKQPDSWRANQLAPVQIEDNSTALQAYRGTMGELLKHQRSHLSAFDKYP
ncbi:hypothetical protein PCASD_01532 [Puccinia coronata f. sp. avenae]|uniref:Uncharacterized protein n=1 Tax=Puccinia coronata f. sp. avenae TaxID=200324 RepID=A0A2N5VIQ4_9BASI|nr:hypothetical protein PCASD_01532 [Puccinia coronata f. sp. avenae]